MPGLHFEGLYHDRRGTGLPVLSLVVLLVTVALACSGCARRAGMLDPPGAAVGDVFVIIDQRERLTRQERAAMADDPVYTVMVGQFRIERRADRSAWLWLDDEHAVQLVEAGRDGLAQLEAAGAGEWCLTPRMFMGMFTMPFWIGEPLGALPEALAERLRRADLPGRHEAANLAAYLLGRSITPFQAQTQTERAYGRFRLSEAGRRKLLDAVARYYEQLRALDRPAAAR